MGWNPSYPIQQTDNSIYGYRQSGDPARNHLVYFPSTVKQLPTEMDDPIQLYGSIDDPEGKNPIRFPSMKMSL